MFCAIFILADIKIIQYLCIVFESDHVRTTEKKLMFNYLKRKDFNYGKIRNSHVD